VAERASRFAVTGKNHVQPLGQNLLYIAVLLNRDQAQGLRDFWLKVAGNLTGIGAGLSFMIHTWNEFRGT
jgi:hypothetical protein